MNRTATGQRNRVFGLFLAIAMAIPLAAWAEAKVSYIQNFDLVRPAKEAADSVEFFPTGAPPGRPGIVLGALSVASDGAQAADDLVALAKSRAASMGADYIQLIKATEDTKFRVEPSYSFALPLLRIPMLLGGRGGHETKVEKVPTMVFAIGVYQPTTLGIHWETTAGQKGRYVVEEFRSYSRAPDAGIQVGDIVLEMNGMQMSDSRNWRIFFENPAGTKVTLYLRRGQDRLSVEVETVAVR